MFLIPAMMITSFLFFLLLFTLIGLSSVLQSRKSKQDYYLASQSISPALAGLSAVATNNSGYMFIGVIGYTYATGLASIWLMLGWIIGDWISSTFIHKRLNQACQRTGEVSFAGVLSAWNGSPSRTLQRLIGLVSLLFLLAYASAQLVAGSKALQVLLEWPSWAGAVMGAIMVAGYCWAGGIRASIWTDAAQSVVMILAMGVLLITAVSSAGGSESVLQQMHAIPGFMDWLPKDLLVPGLIGGIIFAIGWGFAGFSVIGQPHVMVRFMAMQADIHINQARWWYYIWFSAFYLMATAVGMLSRIYLGNGENFDAEMALPTMALQLLDPMLVGLVLAGIFAATMSTTDSLILSCSSALTHDLLPKKEERLWLVKISTLGITIIALLLALSNSQSVFSLVIMAWSGLASAFAPLLITLAIGGKPSAKQGITALISGLAAALLWRYFDLHTLLYEGMAGIITGLFILSPALLKKRHATLQHQNIP